MIPEEFIELMRRKAELEHEMSEAIREFEEFYLHHIEIGDFRLERMRAIGPRSAVVVIVDLRITQCQN